MPARLGFGTARSISRPVEVISRLGLRSFIYAIERRNLSMRHFLPQNRIYLQSARGCSRATFLTEQSMLNTRFKFPKSALFSLSFSSTLLWAKCISPDPQGHENAHVRSPAGWAQGPEVMSRSSRSQSRLPVIFKFPFIVLAEVTIGGTEYLLRSHSQDSPVSTEVQGSWSIVP